MNKLTREAVAKAMLSSAENYLFEILDSVQLEAGELTPEDTYILNAWVRSAIEKATAELEAQ